MDAMAVAPLGPVPDDSVAIRVENVTKVYGLWSSPSARLNYPLLTLLERWAPTWFGIKDALAARRERMFREFRAIEDISLEIRKGESWGIIGVNGSGKSTLLKIISGNLTPTGGRVEVDGKVAILDYSSGLHGSFTGRENVYLKASMLGVSRREIDQKIDDIIAFAEIGDFIDQPVKTYSSGMTARLGFAIIAHLEADIIITDEALAVGDAFFVQKSMNYLRSFLARGTFLFVSHSTNDIVSLCQKAVWLEHGRIRKMGTAKEVADAYLSSRSLQVSKEFMAREQPTSQELVEQAENASGDSPRRREQHRHAEVQQPGLSELNHSHPARVVRDPRLEFLNRSPWRNDIQIPDFAPGDQGFGLGGARIGDVRFEDEEGRALSWVIGGEVVRLVIEIAAEQELPAPIVGFQVRDRLGQTLFADNTYLVTVDRPFPVGKGRRFQAEFTFQMPLLPVGDYVIRPAVAIGTESDNAMLHCIDEGLVFRVTTSGSRHGLVGVPMQSIRIGLAAQSARHEQELELEASSMAAPR